MPTLNVNITFNMVVKIGEDKNLDDLLFKNTEWIGEPCDADGVVIAMVPKKYDIIKGNEIISTSSNNIVSKKRVNNGRT